MELFSKEIEGTVSSSVQNISDFFPAEAEAALFFIRPGFIGAA